MSLWRPFLFKPLHSLNLELTNWLEELADKLPSCTQPQASQVSVAGSSPVPCDGYCSPSLLVPVTVCAFAFAPPLLVSGQGTEGSQAFLQSERRGFAIAFFSFGGGEGVRLPLLSGLLWLRLGICAP